MIDAKALLEKLKSDDQNVKKAAVSAAKTLSVTDRNELFAVARREGGLANLHTLLTGEQKKPDPSKIVLPSIIREKSKRLVTHKEMKPVEVESYGIYTVGDTGFFPGIVAIINSLRENHCHAPIAVIDIGFDLWMINYLKQYEGVQVLDIAPLVNLIRFTDVKTDESPVTKGWAYKAFGIVHYNLFDSWTFIDGDFLPLCNLEEHLRPLVKRGKFVCTEDGQNTWDANHVVATGVRPGKYMNINAGFISVNMRHHGYIIHEWRNLMTRRALFDLWYGDQGALNVTLDKYDIEKTLLDKKIWNQTLINTQITQKGLVELKDGKLFHKGVGKPLMGWHGMGWHKLWHQAGIDLYRKNDAERRKFQQESQGKSPKEVVDEFVRLLFLDKFNKPLRRRGHLVRV